MATLAILTSGTMWKLVDDEKITFFGTSATYINLLKAQNYRPKDLFDLSSLKLSARPVPLFQPKASNSPTMPSRKTSISTLSQAARTSTAASAWGPLFFRFMQGSFKPRGWV